MAGALVGATSGSVGWLMTARVLVRVGASVFTPMSLALVAAGLGLAARTALGCGAQMLEWGLVVVGVGLGLAQSFGIATAMDTVPVEAEWTAGCFSDSACLCFRLPSLSPGNRFRPRRGCDTLGLSEDGHDCISARSTRQYP